MQSQQLQAHAFAFNPNPLQYGQPPNVHGMNGQANMYPSADGTNDDFLSYNKTPITLSWHHLNAYVDKKKDGLIKRLRNRVRPADVEDQTAGYYDQYNNFVPYNPTATATQDDGVKYILRDGKNFKALLVSFRN